MKPGERLLFLDCKEISRRLYCRDLCRNGIEKKIYVWRQVFRCKSVKGLLIHSGAKLETGPNAVHIRATVKRFDMGAIRILRPVIVPHTETTERQGKLL